MTASIERKHDRDNPDFPHGTAGYGYGCRCKRCVSATSLYRRKKRAQGRENRPMNLVRAKAKRQPGAFLPRTHEVAAQIWWNPAE